MQYFCPPNEVDYRLAAHAMVAARRELQSAAKLAAGVIQAARQDVLLNGEEKSLCCLDRVFYAATFRAIAAFARGEEVLEAQPGLLELAEDLGEDLCENFDRLFSEEERQLPCDAFVAAVAARLDNYPPVFTKTEVAEQLRSFAWGAVSAVVSPDDNMLALFRGELSAAEALYTFALLPEVLLLAANHFSAEVSELNICDEHVEELMDYVEGLAPVPRVLWYGLMDGLEEDADLASPSITHCSATKQRQEIMSRVFQRYFQSI